ncbi:hypothetical protein QCA50_016628 [Cerrena zonata]|uniref:Uncharacterized protein n=1 Tax=Cerrena zonata TaxID=2478898 RepID=A0AAW0FS81_9APHY
MSRTWVLVDPCPPCLPSGGTSTGLTSTIDVLHITTPHTFIVVHRQSTGTQWYVRYGTPEPL